MRWFKHMTNSASDEKLAILRSEFGLEGYGFWWRVMEIVAEKVDENGKDFVTFPLNIWASLLGLSPKKFQKMAEFCSNFEIFHANFEKTHANFEKFHSKSEKNIITISIPNLLKYRDEYTIKKSRKSRQCPDTLPPLLTDTDTDTDTETDTNKEKEKDIGCVCVEDLNANSKGKKTDAPSKGHPQWQSFQSCFSLYPVQQAKEAAWREWVRLHENGTLAECWVIHDKILDLIGNDARWLAGSQYIPSFEKWLRDKRWDDEPIAKIEESAKQFGNEWLTPEQLEKMT